MLSTGLLASCALLAAVSIINAASEVEEDSLKATLEVRQQNLERQLSSAAAVAVPEDVL
ncbi:hypothetical protein GVX82_00955 [Patescibacteria group bacterium]|nr:hypothetical protein [Patescibacteria group bacterium]